MRKDLGNPFFCCGKMGCAGFFSGVKDADIGSFAVNAYADVKSAIFFVDAPIRFRVGKPLREYRDTSERICLARMSDRYSLPNGGRERPANSERSRFFDGFARHASGLFGCGHFLPRRRGDDPSGISCANLGFGFSRVSLPNPRRPRAAAGKVISGRDHGVVLNYGRYFCGTRILKGVGFTKQFKKERGPTVFLDGSMEYGFGPRGLHGVADMVAPSLGDRVARETNIRFVGNAAGYFVDVPDQYFGTHDRASNARCVDRGRILLKQDAAPLTLTTGG